MALDEYMDRLATEHGLKLTALDYKTKFQELITRLGAQEKIVLLVDEYDKAILID